MGKRYSTIVAIVIILCTYSSCNKVNEGVQVVDTDAKNIISAGLSEVFNISNYVILENTVPLINRIGKVIKTKEFIFVLDFAFDGSKVLQFDNRGHYLKQIGSVGHGPGQYYSVADFAIDTINSKVYIASLGSVLCYGFNSEFLNSIIISGEDELHSSVNFITSLEKELWVFTDEMVPLKTENIKWKYYGKLIRFNDRFKVIDTTKILEASLKADWFGGISANILSVLKDNMYVYFPILLAEPFLRDTLYTFNNLQKIPAIKFDFSDILVIDKNIEYNTSNPQKILEAQLRTRNITIRSIYRTERYVFVNYTNIKFEEFLFCYDLVERRGYHMAGGFTDDLFKTEKIINLIPINLQSGEFCFVKNAYEIEEIYTGVNENSNPVIFFIKTVE